VVGRALQLGLASAGPLLAGGSIVESHSSVTLQQERERLTVLYNHNQFDFDPHAVVADSSLVLLGVYEMLLQLKGSSADAFTPMLADAWESSTDRSSYTFHLSPRVTFHDGTPCDAAAVKASFVRFLEMAAPSVYIVSRFVEDPDQIVVVDDRTVRFDLDRPQPLFLAAMASPFGPYVLNPRHVEAHRTADDPWAHEWFSRNSEGAGTGPYVIADDRPGDQTVLRRFEDYHRGWAGEHFDEVVIRVVGTEVTRRQLLERGDADMVTRLLSPEDVEALREQPELCVATYDSFDVGWIVMNAPKLRTPEVRRGFSYAFPYDKVIEGVEGGRRKRTGPIPAGMRGYDPAVYLYPTDVGKARELIRSGGFADGDRFDYIYLAGSESSRAIAELFQANLQSIGFSLELAEVDQGALFDIGFGELPADERPDFLGTWGWYPDYNDPWVHLAPCFRRSYVEGGPGAANPGLWVNDRFEQLMLEAQATIDEGRLDQLMQEAQRILTEEDPPCIYLGQQIYETVHAADVRGFEGNPVYLNFYRFYQMYRAAEQR
jgi:peptide/nickel transport system substrate-binding protein